MANVSELELDLQELQGLLGKAERQKVKGIITVQIKKIQDEITILQHPTLKADGDNNPPKIAAQSKSNVQADGDRCYEVKLSNYAWDQSEKFVKVYLMLDGVHKLPKEKVKCQFSPKSLDMTVSGLGNKNYSFVLVNLLEPIVVDGSYFKLKTDMVVIFMKKESLKTWSNISIHDKKAKEPKVPKMEEDADPNKGLMDLMKQMYDDGDDEMKRTIAKAWTESRNKSPDLGAGL